MIEGLDELLDEFDDLSDETLDALRMGLDKGLKRTVALAKQLAPVRDGQLRNSITSYTERMGQEIEGTVIAGAAHAVYVEMGTGDRGHGADNGKAPGATYTAGWPGQEPEPYMYPAYKQTKELILNDARQAIENARAKGG